MWKHTSFRVTILSGLSFCCFTGEVFGAGTSQSVPAVAPKSVSLVAQYKFEGNAADTSTAQPGPAGILVGSPTYEAGPFGQAVCFDGNDYVDCGNRSSFNLTRQLTVATWIKVNKFDKKYQTIISKGDNSWRLARANESDSIEFACDGTAATKWNGTGEVPWAVVGTTSANDGKWHHIAGVFDGSTLYLYIDGVLEAAKSGANSVSISKHNVLIGANAQVPGREWNGLIDDVRIYDYALSQAEIASVMGKSEINLLEPVPATFFGLVERYDKAKKLEEAKGVCQLIVQQYPESPYASDAQLYISKRNIESLIESKEYAEIPPALDKMKVDFANHPGLPEALYSIAGKHSRARKFEEAEGIYRDLIQRFPDDPYAVKAKLNAPKIHVYYLIDSGNYGQVQPAIDQLVADCMYNPDVPGIIYWFGKELEALKRYEDAKSVYQRVARDYFDNPHAPKAEVRIPKMDILALIESGNDRAAETAVDSLIATFRDNSDLSESVFNIGEQYYNQAASYEAQNLNAKAGDCFRRALVVWEKMITQLPKSIATAWAHNLSADCYRRFGEHQRAIGHYQALLDGWPDYEYAWNVLFLKGRAYQQLKESGVVSESDADMQTRVAYEQLLKKYPTCKAVKYARNWLSRNKSK
jgi:tetratricopeptide (TPR) repeat protein